MFGKNVGSTDRIMRALVGGGLAAVELAGYLGSAEQYFHYFAIAMAVWLLGTGTTGTCPTYTFLGISTCAHDSDEEE
ncbi:MAG: DUF2892 domain-containing protein [Candidatus Thermoplasmatota archaeon]|nr:DUF2892 domain-containing protein [Candidatus Thermoplasmatota archaeon]MEE3083206.1 DUF2892 domain-containing protein [Candidatus Thermoplasmatota archaeon]